MSTVVVDFSGFISAYSPKQPSNLPGLLRPCNLNAKTRFIPVVPAAIAEVKPGAPVFIPAGRNADGALAVGFVVAGANRVAPPMETNRHGACAG